MTSIQTFARRFAQDENGASAIEYGLLAGLISVAVVTGAGLAGNALNSLFSAIANKLPTTIA